MEVLNVLQELGLVRIYAQDDYVEPTESFGPWLERTQWDEAMRLAEQFQKNSASSEDPSC